MIEQIWDILQCLKSITVSSFSYVATHQLSPRHNTMKWWVMSSVNSALDETRWNNGCQEVYGSGEWEHCCFSMEICPRRGKNGYISWKLRLRYSSQSFQIGQGKLTSLSQPRTLNQPILSGWKTQVIYSCQDMLELFLFFLEKTPLLVWTVTSGSVAIGAATSHKPEWVINNNLHLWVCTV